MRPAERVTGPRLTIVIPTVNRAGLVGRAIDSALAQTYPDLEIIVSNNGSTDDTRAVLDRYEGSARLRILHQPKTIPVDAHSAVLLPQIAGTLSLTLSDDDWLEPDFATKVIELYDRHPDVSFVYTGCFLHYGDAAMPAKTGPEIEVGTEFLAAYLAGDREVIWCACVIRTFDLRRLLPSPPGVICGDWLCWISLASSGQVGCVPDPLSHYVQYRDAGDGMAGGCAVAAWASEIDGWTREMVAVCTKGGADGPAFEILRRKAVEFVARSTADQFVWQALRGVSRFRLLRDLRVVIPYLRRGSALLWVRVIAALLAPRRLLRNRVISMARARAAKTAKPLLTE
jgi:hypothetical protein